MPVKTMIEQLQQLLNCYEEMHALALEKKEVLTKHDVEQLSVIVNRESKLVKRISGHDRLCMEASMMFVKKQGFFIKGSLTVKQLSGFVTDAKAKQELLALHNELTGSIQKVQDINRLNQQLIQQALEYVNFSLELFSGYSEQDVVYSNPKRNKSGTALRGSFDAKT